MRSVIIISEINSRVQTPKMIQVLSHTVFTHGKKNEDASDLTWNRNPSPKKMRMRKADNSLGFRRDQLMGGKSSNRSFQPIRQGICWNMKTLEKVRRLLREEYVVQQVKTISLNVLMYLCYAKINFFATLSTYKGRRKMIYRWYKTKIVL